MGIGNNSLLIISIVIIFLLSQTRNVHGGIYKVTHTFGDELAVEDPKNHIHHRGRLLAADGLPLHGRGVVSSGLYCVEIPVAFPLLQMGTSASDDALDLLVDHCCEMDNHPCPRTSKYITTFILHYVNFRNLNENTTRIAATSRATFGYGPEQRAAYGPVDPSHDLVVSGKVTKKKFSHCLDGRNGVGIVVFGDVVQPSLKTTPLFSNHSHYYVNMKAIEVGNVVLNFSNEVFPVTDGKSTMIDSGTTVAYFPVGIFNELYKMVMSSQLSTGLETRIVQDNYTCFSFNKRFDLFHVSPDRKDMIVLGDLILSNRVLLYDLEKNSLGFAEQHCSSATVVTDEETGDAYLVNAKHHVMPSTSSSLNSEWVLMLFLVAAILYLLDSL
ncbi:hypothetical protein MKX03_021074 [Papaver bracteatum]|nr:hypothetical protein MKX03_021074 [Papaver bracteatum]